jgi:carotenoid cleavage dioxygenase-like enzyme
VWGAAGDKRYCMEPIFVPKTGTSAAVGDVDYNEGYILVNVNDFQVPGQERTCLEILDAADIAAGPVATIDLEELLAPGLHGSWTARYFGLLTDEQLPFEHDIRLGL